MKVQLVMFIFVKETELNNMLRVSPRVSLLLVNIFNHVKTARLKSHLSYFNVIGQYLAVVWRYKQRIQLSSKNAKRLLKNFQSTREDYFSAAPCIYPSHWVRKL